MSKRTQYVPALVAAVILGTGALTPAASDAESPDAGRTLHGPSAIAELGDRLDETAALNGWTPRHLRAVLRSDPRARIDPTGRVFYLEQAAPPGIPAGPGVPADAAPHPLVDTFKLHSRPGSQRTILLDFDGFNLTGTAWNGAPKSVPAGSISGWSLDADPNTFSNTELEAIQSIWQRVAEDYAPFNVDVSTEDLGDAIIHRTNLADQIYGTRVVITNSTVVSDAVCNSLCGGSAYVDVFDLPGSSHAFYQPALVFGHMLGNNPKSIAEASSHEAGHNLGLSHDGRTSPAEAYYDGHGVWAPIMGGGYYRPLVQWSRGEYPNADNTQDDIAIIASNGAPLLADDVGNTLATASTSLAGTHMISPSGDVDVYFLGTCTGQLIFNAGAPSPVTPSPNLDIRLDLLDGGGDVVAWADPVAQAVTSDIATGLSANLTETVGTGSYFLRVDGVGSGTTATGYSDYGSIGRYQVSMSGSGSCSPGSGPPGAVRGLAAAPGTGDSHELSWRAPANIGAGAITGYDVTINGSPYATVTAPSIALAGLTVGETYSLAVTAKNPSGAGPSSTTTYTVPDPPPPPPAAPQTAKTAPGAPEIGKAKSGAKGGKVTAKIKWRPPTDTGGVPITSYRIVVLNSRGKTVKTVKAPALATSREIKLKRGKYRFAVIALNEVGSSPRSAASNAVRAR